MAESHQLQKLQNYLLGDLSHDECLMRPGSLEENEVTYFSPWSLDGS